MLQKAPLRPGGFFPFGRGDVSKCKKVEIQHVLDTLNFGQGEAAVMSAFATLHQHLDTSIEELCEVVPKTDQPCQYAVCDLKRIAKYNPGYYRVAFTIDPRIGTVFYEFNNLLAFFEEVPLAKEYIHLLFMHQSVVNLIRTEGDLRRLFRRMPLTATEIVRKYPHLLNLIPSFRVLLKYTRLAPHAKPLFFQLRANLITTVDDLDMVSRIAPECAVRLLSTEWLSFLGINITQTDYEFIMEYAQQRCRTLSTLPAQQRSELLQLQEELLKSLNNKSTQCKLAIISSSIHILQKFAADNGDALLKVVIEHPDVRSELLTAVFGSKYSVVIKEFDQNWLTLFSTIQNEQTFDLSKLFKAYLTRLNQGLEENNIFSILQLAKLHLHGLPPIYRHENSRSYRSARFYLDLATRLINHFDSMEPDDPARNEFRAAQLADGNLRQQLIELNLQYVEVDSAYLRKHPLRVNNICLSKIKTLEGNEARDCRECHFELQEYRGSSKQFKGEQIIIDRLLELPYQLVLKYALNSDEIKRICSDPRMTLFWTRVLRNYGLENDQCDVLGSAFRHVMGQWLLSHYKQWQLVGKGKEPHAEELLDEAIKYSSGMAMYIKNLHLFETAKQRLLSQQEQQQLISMADKLMSEHFTFGFVVTAIIYLNFADYYINIDHMLAKDCLRKVLVCLYGGEFLENHQQSRLEFNNNRTTKDILVRSSGLGRELTSFEKARLAIMQKLGIGQFTVSDCATEYRAQSRSYYMNSPTRFAADPFEKKQNSEIAFDLCRDIEDRWEKMSVNAEMIRDTLPKTGSPRERETQGSTVAELKVVHDRLIARLESGESLRKALNGCDEDLALLKPLGKLKPRALFPDNDFSLERSMENK